MAKETKEVAVSEAKEVAVSEAKENMALSLRSSAGDGEDYSKFEGDANDILLPRLLIAQQMSDVVVKEKVSAGRVYRNTNAEVVGGKGDAFEIIPLYMTKTWVISGKKTAQAQKFEFVRIEPFTPSNADALWNFKENGLDFKREQNLNFFCLIPQDIARDLEARRLIEETGELPDLDAALLPCVLSFKSTSMKAGRALVTHFSNAATFNLPPFINKFQINTELVEKEGNKFYVFTVAKDKATAKTDPAHLPACKTWREIVGSHKVQIAEEGALEADAVVTNVTPSRSEF